MKISFLMKAGILLPYITGLALTVYSQSEPIPVSPGDPLPDFQFNDVIYPGKTKIAKEDLKGKYVILDFWTTNCTGCIKAFPKVNELQKKFKGQVEILLVGSDFLPLAGIEKAKTVFEKFRKFWKLELNAAFDTAAFRAFRIQSVSRYVWINPKGEIVAATSNSGMTEDNIRRFLEGREIIYRDFNQADPTFDERKPLLIGGNGGNDTSYISRCILAPWDPKSGFAIPEGFYGKRPYGTGLRLQQLYHLAYFGIPQYLYAVMSLPGYEEVAVSPIIQTKDSSLFEADIQTGKNLFSFQLEIKGGKATPEQYQQAFRALLDNSFDFDVSIEIREMPCWKLVATKKAVEKLRTKSREPMKVEFEDPKPTKYWGPDGFAIENKPAYYILKSIWCWQQNEPNYVDATGIDFPVDFRLDAVMTSFTDIQRALREQGLDLVKSTAMLKTLVIRDRVHQ